MAHGKIIRTWTDPLGRTVVLTFHRWTDHVLVRHLDMLFRIEDVGKTIMEPEAILRHRNERLYYRKAEGRRRSCFKVVVRDGEVVTAYRVPKMQQRGVLEWQKP